MAKSNTRATADDVVVEDASGNFGLGATPTAKLDVRRDDADGKIAEFHTSTGYGVEIGSSQSEAYIQSGYQQALILGTNSTERMRIDSIGNVLVGKTDAAIATEGTFIGGGSNNGTVEITRDQNRPLRLNRTTNDGTILELLKNGSTVGAIGTTDGDLTIDGEVKLYHNGSPKLATFSDGITVGDNQLQLVNANTMIGRATEGVMTLNTNGSERLRVDSSGNVLVGTSGTVPATGNVNGFRVDESGYISLTGAGTAAIDANRKSSDGTIINLRKDGSTVGGIGTSSGSMYIEGNPATGKSGLTFYGACIEPRDNGSPADNAIDLGSTANRFKDAHFSGTVTADAFSGPSATKAWVNFNASSSNAIGDSYGISSITDLANGKFEVNLSTAMSNDKYATASAAWHNDGNSGHHEAWSGPKSASVVYVFCGWQSSIYDITDVQLIVFGD